MHISDCLKLLEASILRPSNQTFEQNVRVPNGARRRGGNENGTSATRMWRLKREGMIFRKRGIQNYDFS